MQRFLRFLIGLLLLPACWGVGKTFVHAIAATSGGFSVGTFSLLGESSSSSSRGWLCRALCALMCSDTNSRMRFGDSSLGRCLRP